MLIIALVHISFFSNSGWPFYYFNLFLVGSIFMVYIHNNTSIIFIWVLFSGMVFDLVYTHDINLQTFVFPLILFFLFLLKKRLLSQSTLALLVLTFFFTINYYVIVYFVINFLPWASVYRFDLPNMSSYLLYGTLLNGIVVVFVYQVRIYLYKVLGRYFVYRKI